MAADGLARRGGRVYATGTGKVMGVRGCGGGGLCLRTHLLSAPLSLLHSCH